MTKLPIYLDYASSTPLDPRVSEQMCAALNSPSLYGNPHATTHLYGSEALKLITTARQQVAHLLHAQLEEIIWTSGATEANNLALFGAARFYQRRGKHLISAITEHKAVITPLQQLANEGFEVTWLQPQQNGLIRLTDLETAIRPDTILISLMLVNNEIGVIQDLPAIANLVKKHGILLHVDAAQAVGKIPIDLGTLPIDLLSISSHKIYGPKGIGALYIRQQPIKIRLQPLLYGGNQERGIRPGTLATHQIVGLGTALMLAQTEMAAEMQRLTILRQRLLTGLNSLPGITLNGHPSQHIPGIVNISIAGVAGESLLLSLRKLAISASSACTSSSNHSSYVLRALGVDEALAQSSLRISFGRFTTAEEIDTAVSTIIREVQRLRALAPS